MGLEVGYNQIDKGEKIYLKYPFKTYNTYLSKLTKQSHPTENFLIKLYTLSSAYGSKYAIKLRNFFFYNFNNRNQNDICRFNFEISKKSKLIQMINFDISPIIKLTMNNFLSVKYGHYEANKEQYINNYDYSQVFPSMIPHNRLSFSLNKYFPLFKYSIYRAKMTFNKIFNFENNIELTNELKTNYIYDLLNFSKINISSETSIKKSISFFNQQNKKYSHITSGFSAISKLLEMTIPNKQNEISSVNFFIRNLLTFRFENINLPFIRNISEKISPYTSIETFILPKSKPVLRSILSLGFGIKLQDKFYLDFSLYTKASENINIKKHLINRFKIKIGN